MCDFEYLICTEIHKKLKEKVKGTVWVKVYNNELHVTIKNGDINYEFVACNFAKQVMEGVCSDFIVYAVTTEYKHYLHNYYFK